mgnify:CR=1 FL=1
MTTAPIRIFIVDDSALVRRSLTEIISREPGFKVIGSAEDPIAAERKMQPEWPDVIFLDVVMPGIDGYAACKNIKRSKLNKHTPVIMLTSRSSKFDKLKGVLAGCDTYLTKPINHNEFKEITQKHLDALNLRTQKLENK